MGRWSIAVVLLLALFASPFRARADSAPPSAAADDAEEEPLDPGVPSSSLDGLPGATVPGAGFL